MAKFCGNLLFTTTFSFSRFRHFRVELKVMKKRMHHRTLNEIKLLIQLLLLYTTPIVICQVGSGFFRVLFLSFFNLKHNVQRSLIVHIHIMFVFLLYCGYLSVVGYGSGSMNTNEIFLYDILSIEKIKPKARLSELGM